MYIDLYYSTITNRRNTCSLLTHRTGASDIGYNKYPITIPPTVIFHFGCETKDDESLRLQNLRSQGTTPPIPLSDDPPRPSDDTDAQIDTVRVWLFNLPRSSLFVCAFCNEKIIAKNDDLLPQLNTLSKRNCYRYRVQLVIVFWTLENHVPAES